MRVRRQLEQRNAFGALRVALAGTALAIFAIPVGALEVVSVSPERHSLAVATDARVRIEFDRPVDPESVTAASFWLFGRWSGDSGGQFRFSRDRRTVTLKPARRFSAGEQVMVLLSRHLTGADGSSLREGGYSFQFWTGTRGEGFDFTEIDRFTTRSSPDVATRSYGGFGSDLDGDGFLDVTIVNEDTDDLRVFMNRGDRSGLLSDFLEPAIPVGNVPSPSEPSDFNRDGHADVAIGNTRAETVSILLGNGDGTFAPAQTVFVGREPRGVAVLDADGDGDVDVAATSFVLGQVTILENDGDGNFSAGAVFGTESGERALAAGDMNDDGLLDLVVGALTSQEVHVWVNDGEGGFTRTANRSSGGETWMLMLGDVDGDGAEDVNVVNSQADNGGFLMGDGAGGLGEARLLPTDPFPLATDLGDLDGDGDLDWVSSSFFGNWTLFENDGTGSFEARRFFAAPQAASCALPMDLDNDGVLDLVLIDELADEVFLVAGRSVLLLSDFETGTTAGWSRAKGPVAVVQPGPHGVGSALAVPAGPNRAYVESRRPDRETSLDISFSLQPNNVDLAGSRVEILRLGGGKASALLTLERTGKRYRVRLFAREGGRLRRVGSTRLRADRPVDLRVEWSAATGSASADGSAALFKEGRLSAVARDLANHGETIKRVRLGLPKGGSTGASGSFLVDEVFITR